jgi:hypothetical protein
MFENGWISGQLIELIGINRTQTWQVRRRVLFPSPNSSEVSGAYMRIRLVEVESSIY